METLNKTEQKFLNLVKKHTDSMKEGDSKIANIIHAKLHELYNDSLKNHYNNMFLKFLDDDDFNVRHWSSIFSLRKNTKLAVDCLENIIKSNSSLQFEAEITLELWNNNKLNLI